MNREQYHRYLASREWALKKEAVKRRSGGICERCRKNPHEQTHHLTYIRLGNEHLEDLQGVCRMCHEYLSGKSNFDPATSPYRNAAEEEAAQKALKEIREFYANLEEYNRLPEGPRKAQLRREIEKSSPRHICDYVCDRYGCPCS